MDSIRDLKVISAEGCVLPGLLKMRETSPHGADLVRLELTVGEREYKSDCRTFFEALIDIRLQLESNDMLLCCLGASEDVYPSSMCLNMGVGNKAYRIRLGQRPTVEDIVDIFDTHDDIVPVSVAVQRQYFEKWVGSVK